MSMPRLTDLVLALLPLLTAAGCAGGVASTPAPDAVAFAGLTDLTATVVENAHIELRWRNRATQEGGTLVEFRMGPDESFTLLEVLPPQETGLRHPDVAPDTAYSYRVRPFFGRTSEVVRVTTGAAPAGSDTSPGEDGPLEAEAAETRPGGGTPLRAAATFADAHPTGLTATLSAPTRVDLRWQDRASDEEGYLVEMRTDVDREYRVCAFLPAEATSFRKTQLPPRTRCDFRVRAYFSGPPSNAAGVTTPPRSGLAPPEAKASPEILRQR